MKKSARWEIICPVAALLFQLVPPICYLTIASAAYGAGMHIPDPVEVALTQVAIGLSALIGMFLASLGVYLLLTRCRFWTAMLLIATCCVPATLAACMHLYGLLFFAALA